jgi:hypothetical protein
VSVRRHEITDRKDSRNETSEDRPEHDASRRAALARMGRFAGYTAPVMLGLLGATKARAEVRSSPAPCPV